jgi:hypothetical protein
MDDIGARLALPSTLVELSNATGVPKYRMAGSLDTIIGSSFAG